MQSPRFAEELRAKGESKAIGASAGAVNVPGKCRVDPISMSPACLVGHSSQGHVCDHQQLVVVSAKRCGCIPASLDIMVSG